MARELRRMKNGGIQGICKIPELLKAGGKFCEEMACRQFLIIMVMKAGKASKDLR